MDHNPVVPLLQCVLSSFQTKCHPFLTPIPLYPTQDAKTQVCQFHHITGTNHHPRTFHSSEKFAAQKFHGSKVYWKRWILWKKNQEAKGTVFVERPSSVKHYLWAKKLWWPRAFWRSWNSSSSIKTWEDFSPLTITMLKKVRCSEIGFSWYSHMMHLRVHSYPIPHLTVMVLNSVLKQKGNSCHVWHWLRHVMYGRCFSLRETKHLQTMYPT